VVAAKAVTVAAAVATVASAVAIATASVKKVAATNPPTEYFTTASRKRDAVFYFTISAVIQPPLMSLASKPCCMSNRTA
jgi:hypothetical protein